MKWEPAALMVLLILLGVLVVQGPRIQHDLRPGARAVKVQFAGHGVLEVLEDPPGSGRFSFRVLFRNGFAGEVFGDEQFIERYGQEQHEHATAHAGNVVFRALNITSWAGVAWVALGFAAQAAFFGRMFIQWMVSEKRRESVIPPVFWYLSLFGGIGLFTYFAWRQDIVGVLGQSSGIVIYARNIRLIFKQRRRERRAAERQAAAETGPAPSADASPSAHDAETTDTQTPPARDGGERPLETPAR